MLTQYDFFRVQGNDLDKYEDLSYEEIKAMIPWSLEECMSTPVNVHYYSWFPLDETEYQETDSDGNRWYYHHDPLIISITVYSGIFCFENEDSTVLSFDAERFRVELHHSKKLEYKFFDRGILIFSGDDFRPSPCHADDSIETFLSLLSFLSLQKGDTDDEYFDEYTPAQLEWRDESAEDLALARLEIITAFDIEH